MSKIFKQDAQTILQNWHTHGALWLMEDPDWFFTHDSEILTALAQATQEHVEFMTDMVSASLRMYSAFTKATPQEQHMHVAFVHVVVARNKHTPPEILADLASLPLEEPAASVARHPRTSADTFALLAKSKWDHVRQDVAENVHTPIHILAELAQDADSLVVRRLAGNPSVSAQILASLANHEYWHVRYAVAKHKNTPAFCLDRLRYDPLRDIRQAALQNPNIPPARGWQIVKEFFGW